MEFIAFFYLPMLYNIIGPNVIFNVVKFSLIANSVPVNTRKYICGKVFLWFLDSRRSFYMFFYANAYGSSVPGRRILNSFQKPGTKS